MATRVGFIGLGQMGFPMAQNILKKGFPVTVYNRTKEKASPILEQGAKWANSPLELASQCDILVTMIDNDNTLKEIVTGPTGIIHAQNKPSIHISMSTVSPELIASLEKVHQEHGITLLAAPVSGRPERAKQGTLWIFSAGQPAAKQAAAHVLEAMSCKIFDLGDRPEQAAIFKLCSNFMILSLIETISEATTLLEKNGVSAEKASEVWGNSLFDAPIFHIYGPIISKRSFANGGFALDLGLKDMRLLQTCADNAHVPMPFLTDLHAKLIASMNIGRAKFDWSAITLITREQAGLKS